MALGLDTRVVRRLQARIERVVEDGPWDDWNSCWFNRLYTRVVPSHAVELTAAYLDRSVSTALDRHQPKLANHERLQELAAVIHLCGSGAGDAYAQRGMRLADGQLCGDHEARDYVARVNTARHLFESLRAADAHP